MGTRQLGAVIVAGLLVSACGDPLTAPGGANQRIVGNYLVEFQLESAGLAAGVSTPVAFSVKQARTLYDAETEETYTYWEPVTNLEAVVYCLLPDNSEHFHPAESIGGGVYRAMHTFDPGRTYASLQFTAADGEKLDLGQWVTVPAF